MKSFLFFLFVFISAENIAQINLSADPRIEPRIRARSRQGNPGYRIMISYDSDKSIVDADRQRFIALFPNTDTYVTFEAPNFVLKIGDFRTQLEAEKFKEKLPSDFRVSVIQKENIQAPRLEP